jgi:hypothetical protein
MFAARQPVEIGLISGAEVAFFFAELSSFTS